MAKKILIIEDEIAFIKSMESVLRDKYDVLSAGSGKEGLERAKKEKPDLIMLDLILSDLFGTKVLQKLKKDKATKNIPVIALTCLGDTENVSKALEAGCQDYLVKADFSLNEILQKVEDILK